MDGFGDIIRSETPGKDNGCPDKLGDPAAYAPIVSDAERTDLTVGFSMTVQQQEIGNALVTASNDKQQDPRWHCRGKSEPRVRLYSLRKFTPFGVKPLDL